MTSTAIEIAPSHANKGSETSKAVSAYAASLVLRDGPGKLIGLSGYNSGADQFLQVHDAASLPADTAVPTIVLKILADQNFAFDFGLYGRYFKTGIVVCNSSTGPTKTLGSANCWFEGQTA
jgi:hypothetical protein